MTPRELQKACTQQVPVIIRVPGRAAWKGSCVKAIIMEPNFEKKVWNTYGLVAYWESGEDMVAAQYIHPFPVPT